MAGKLRALTLALVAVCAIGAGAASSASAAEFHIAGMGSATSIGIGQMTLGTPEDVVKCQNITYTNQLLTAAGVPVETTGPTTTSTREEPAHTPIDETLTCTTNGIAGTIVHMNGCDFVTHAGPPVKMDIVCPGSQQITITVIVTGILKCTLHLGAQTGKEGVSITNGAEDILVKTASKSINYRMTSGSGIGACASTPEGTGGELIEEVTLQGTAGGVASKLQYA